MNRNHAATTLTNTVAKRGQFTRPKVRACAGLHPDEARLEPCEEGQNLRPPKLALHHDGAFRVDAVNLKNGLGKIDADGGNLMHGWLPSMVALTAPQYGTLR